MAATPVLSGPHPVLLDTCAAIWLIAGDPLSAHAQAAILESRSVGIYVSPFTAWEVGTLAAKSRLRGPLSPEAWFEFLLKIPGVKLAELSPEILLRSTSLPGTPPSDPADRIIAATARAHGYPILTRDRLLINYAQQGFIQVIPC